MKPPMRPTPPPITRVVRPAIASRPDIGRTAPPPLARPGFPTKPAQESAGKTLDERVNALSPKDALAKRESEMDVALQVFRENKKKERQRYIDLTDTEFWFTVYSRSRGQKEWMLRELGLFDEGDKYLDAETFWDRMRQLIPKLPPLPKEDLKLGTFKANRKLQDISVPLPTTTPGEK